MYGKPYGVGLFVPQSNLLLVLRLGHWIWWVTQNSRTLDNVTALAPVRTGNMLFLWHFPEGELASDTVIKSNESHSTRAM
jgi:hypothetical protein